MCSLCISIKGLRKALKEVKEIMSLKSAGDWDVLQKKYVSLRQSRTKFMKLCQEIKQNWTGQENFEICFCVIFDH